MSKYTKGDVLADVQGDRWTVQADTDYVLLDGARNPDRLSEASLFFGPFRLVKPAVPDVPTVTFPIFSRFATKDSGQREVYSTGMQRDTTAGKARFDLLVPKDVPYADQFLTRFAELMERGATKYDERNWEKANTDEELERFKQSAQRHLVQWLTGEDDEDHAAAVAFNLLAHETTKFKMENL